MVLVPVMVLAYAMVLAHVMMLSPVMVLAHVMMLTCIVVLTYPNSKKTVFLLHDRKSECYGVRRPDGPPVRSRPRRANRLLLRIFSYTVSHSLNGIQPPKFIRTLLGPHPATFGKR